MAPASSTDSTPVYSEFASDPEYRELLEMFGDALPERKQVLRTTWEAANFDELRVLAHQLKGAGGGFGFHDLTDLAANLEVACKSRDSAEIDARMTQLLTYMDRISI